MLELRADYALIQMLFFPFQPQQSVFTLQSISVEFVLWFKITKLSPEISIFSTMVHVKTQSSFPFSIHYNFDRNHNITQIHRGPLQRDQSISYLYLVRSKVYFSVFCSKIFAYLLTKTLLAFKHSSHGSLWCLLSVLFINLRGLFLHLDQCSTTPPPTSHLLPLEMQTSPARLPRR